MGQKINDFKKVYEKEIVIFFMKNEGTYSINL